MGERRRSGVVEGALTAPDEVRRVRAILALGGMASGDLDDGVQQVRLKLAEQQADPDRPSVENPMAWAAVTASRIAVDWHRGRAREAGLRERLLARFERPADQRALDVDRTTALEVAGCLDRLGAENREVVVLRYYADLKVRDIAAVLGVAEGTVKSRLHRAHHLLREALQETEGGRA